MATDETNDAVAQEAKTPTETAPPPQDPATNDMASPTVSISEIVSIGHNGRLYSTRIPTSAGTYDMLYVRSHDDVRHLLETNGVGQAPYPIGNETGWACQRLLERPKDDGRLMLISPVTHDWRTPEAESRDMGWIVYWHHLLAP